MMFNIHHALSALVFATFAVASPALTKRQAIDDATVLNFALTLEHLENAFYSGALAKFDEKAFLKAGLPPWARGRFQMIADHEAAHVKFLSSALGDKATKPCTYTFPYTDPKSFAALSQAIEGVGVTAYIGAAGLITNKDYLTAAASVLSTEARHASWVASAVDKQGGWSGAFDVSLGVNEVFTIAANFITACPSTNPALPVKAFPALDVTKPAPGANAAVTAKSATAPPTHIAFLTGLDKIFVPIKNGKVAVPQGLQGTVYAVATKSATSATDADIVAGPAILSFPVDSNGKPIA